MSSERVDAESTVSGTQTAILARIRQEFGIDDGDRLRWHLEDDGRVRVRVLPQRSGPFDGFDGYEGPETTNVVRDHCRMISS